MAQKVYNPDDQFCNSIQHNNLFGYVIRIYGIEYGRKISLQWDKSEDELYLGKGQIVGVFHTPGT